MSKETKENVTNDEEMEASGALTPEADTPAEAPPEGQAAAEGDVELTVVDGSAGESSDAVRRRVETAKFAPLPQAAAHAETGSMDLLLDVQLEMTAELGRASIPIRDVLQLGPGSIVELDKLAGEPVDVLANGKLIARGEVVVVDESFGVRILELVCRADNTAQTG